MAAEQGDADDAAIVAISDDTTLVSAFDFQEPLLGDPELSGRIAALDVLNKALACGEKPQWAEAIIALPELDSAEQTAFACAMMVGVEQACAKVRCSIVARHMTVIKQPLIGLSVGGIDKHTHIRRRSGARAGDDVILTKPLGTNAIAACARGGLSDNRHWQNTLEQLTEPNLVGFILGQMSAVHALGVCGNLGLLGHCCEIARASQCSLELDLDMVPFLEGAREAVRALSPCNGNFARFSGKILFDSAVDPAD